MGGTIMTGNWPKALVGGKKMRKSAKVKKSDPKKPVKGRDANLAIRPKKPKKEK